MIPLLCEIEVWSGIKPPESLLRSIGSSDHQKTALLSPYEQNIPNPYPSSRSPSNSGKSQGLLSNGASSLPAHSSTAVLPTYEESMAEGLGSTEGPRRNFGQSPNYYSNLEELDRDEKQ